MSVRDWRLLVVLLAAGASAVMTEAVPAVAFNYVHISQFGAPGSQAGDFSEPQGLAIDQSTHDVYVADAGNHRVEKFDASGNFIAAWGWGVSDGAEQSEVCVKECQAGVPGVEPSQFSRPIAIAVDNSSDSSKGDVYVADEVNDTVDKFESNGRYLSSLTGGTSGPFHAMYGVAVDAKGDVWAYDSSGEVYEFDEGGSELRQWSTNDGTSPGLAVDANDNVYVVSGCGCGLVFSSTGQALGELDRGDDGTTGLATDLSANRIFDDQKTFVAKLSPAATLPTTPLTTLGEGILQDGTGVAVDSSSNAVFVADAGASKVYMFAPEMPGPPRIESITVAKVLATTAELKTTIYTGQSDTSYRFEYGTTDSSEHYVPVTATDVGSGLEDVSLSDDVSGLVPGTVYHYRVVAENSHGVIASSDSTFVTFGAAESSGLVDGRVYELVSPPNKNGGNVGFLGKVDTQAAPDGEAVTYGSLTSFGSSQSAELVSQYLSRRGSAGWTTQGISPPASFDSNVSLSPSYEGFSADLSTGVLGWTEPGLTAGAPVGYRNLYVRDNSNGSYQLLTVVAPANGSESHFVGASEDYSHIVFETGDALLEGAVANAQNLYEWTARHLSLVNILPESTTSVPGSAASGGEVPGVVSSDGSRIFWADQHSQLYVREDGIRTTKINESRRLPSLGDGESNFLGATPNGGLVLFSDATALTSSPDDNGGLYEFDTETGNLSDLTPDNSGNPGLLGVLGFSGGGSSVYFVASGQLASGASAGQPNLYLSEDGTLSFIATLSNSDEGDWTLEPGSRDAAVSSDGAYAVFMSDMSLTGYDNMDMSTGRLDSEVFEYDARTGRLHCVSCNPSNEQPIGPSRVPDWSSGSYNPHYLSEGGNRVFFDSADALTPRDTNGSEDVYEWERGGTCARAEGCVYLISSGVEEGESLFADATPSGDDLFFITTARLVPEDVDENVDLYDARVGGGSSPPAAPEQCSGEACAGRLSATPTLESPQTLLSQSPTEVDGSVGQATFEVDAIDRSISGRLAQKGELKLRVRVSKAGRIGVSVTAPVDGHVKQVAFGSFRAKGVGSYTLVIFLDRAARDQLAVRHRLRAAVSVSFSGGARRKRFVVTFDEKVT